MSEGASLTVVGGPLAGTVLTIDDAVDEILVGSDPDCRLSLDLPGVSPIHARVWRDLGGITVYDTRSPRGVYVNDARVADQAALRDGDALWLGPPGDPDSVQLQCRLPEDSVLGAPAVGAPPPLEEAPPVIDPMDELGLEEPPPAPPSVDIVASPEIITETWAEQAVSPAAAPAVVAPPAPEPIEEFVMDPAWADEPAPSTPPPAADLGALLGEASAAAEEPETFFVDEPVLGAPATTPIPAPARPSPAPAPVAPPPPAPAAPVAAAPKPPVPAPAPKTPVAPPAPKPPAATPVAAKPPVPPVAARPPAPPVLPARPARAVIDDVPVRPEPKPRPPARPAGPSEGMMDWARTTSEEEVPAPAPAVRQTGPVARPPAPAGRRLPILPVAGGLLALAAAAGAYYALVVMRTPVIEAVTPARTRIGETVTLTGTHLGDTPADAAVTIGGRTARVTQAAGTRLQVEVPEIDLTPGRDTAAPIVVTAGGRASRPATVAVYLAPRMKALSPEAGMPGDEVVISGTGWGPAVQVRFGTAEAAVVEANAGAVKVKVPPIAGAPGMEVPVTATMGADPSNTLTFVLGHVPLVTGLDVRAAGAGDLVTVSGRGFDASAAANKVKIGGLPALVVSATPRELQVVVPRAGFGESTLEVTVPGSSNKAEVPLAIDPPPDPIGFRFVAEPFEDAPGHEHAAVATGLGPAFVFSAGMGKTAAERARAAQERLNEAGQVIASSREADIRARFQPAPALYLYGRDTVLFDVIGADAAGYDEDWTKSRPKGPAVTPERLAAWWEAEARDLVLLLVRGERPQYAAALAPEGRVFGDLHDAARRRTAVGVPAGLLGEGRTPLKEPLRIAALHVPASVTAPASGPEPAAATPVPGDTTPPLKLSGSWGGTEVEGGSRKSITVSFSGSGGTLTYQRALTLTVPISNVSQQKGGVVRFELNAGTGRHFYRGRWDGSKISGKIYTDPDGRGEAGSFELEPSS